MILLCGVQIIFNEEPIEITGDPSFSALYKLEIDIGGREPNAVLFFKLKEAALKWKNALISASGDY